MSSPRTKARNRATWHRVLNEKTEQHWRDHPEDRPPPPQTITTYNFNPGGAAKPYIPKATITPK